MLVLFSGSKLRYFYFIFFSCLISYRSYMQTSFYSPSKLNPVSSTAFPHLLSNTIRFPKQHCCLEDSQASPSNASGKKIVYMKTRIKNWWNDTDRGKPKYSESNLPQCQHKTNPVLLREDLRLTH